MSVAPPLSQTFMRASRAIERVLAGRSLAAVFAERSSGVNPAVQDLCYGTLRDYAIGDAVIEALAERDVPDRMLRALLLAALRELHRQRFAPHVVVNEAVTACAKLPCAGARGFVNALLRRFLRERERIEPRILAQEPARYRHPQWWIDRVRRAYPDAWPKILEADNGHPPMTLRVNRRRADADAYVARLAAAAIGARRIGREAVRLDVPRPVGEVPGFGEGHVSVQDAGAQLAAHLLDVEDGMRVLDACAAPGGKTAHILELARADLLALDNDAARAARIGANLARLGLDATVQVGDASDPAQWWDCRSFDRILLDAPCTASGVVRRHPDIKWLRRNADIGAFARRQAALLDALWPLLAPGGKLLYATCSVFPDENVEPVAGFVARRADAERIGLPGLAKGQLLPNEDHDGFFYALLRKR